MKERQIARKKRQVSGVNVTPGMVYSEDNFGKDTSAVFVAEGILTKCDSGVAKEIADAGINPDIIFSRGYATRAEIIALKDSDLDDILEEEGIMENEIKDALKEAKAALKSKDDSEKAKKAADQAAREAEEDEVPVVEEDFPVEEDNDAPIEEDPAP